MGRKYKNEALEVTRNCVSLEPKVGFLLYVRENEESKEFS